MRWVEAISAFVGPILTLHMGLSAVAGAIIGDGFSFWLGRHCHSEILGR